MVYSRLKSMGIAAPEAIVERLEDVYLSNAAQNLRLFHQLAGVLQALRAGGVPVIPLKGAGLAEAGVR